MKESILLEDLEIYKLALEIGEGVGIWLSNGSIFHKRVGSQFVEAADSISANIAEGYGRYFYKDRKQFYYYGRGSLMETKNWATKAHKRTLINHAEFDNLVEKLKVLHFKLNNYIKKLKQNTGQPND